MLDDAVDTAHYWQRVAHELADDLAVDALERERAGKVPYDEAARVREAGLPSVLAPPGAAGLGTGMGWADACAVVRRIAAADGSAGELLGRHYALSWIPRFLTAPEQAAELERRAVREQWLWAGETGGPGACPGPVLVPAGEGFLLGGHRRLPTGVHVADRFVLDAVRATTGEAVVVLVDPRHPGVSREPLSDRLGQRLADAGTVHFDAVPVTADQVLGPAAPDEETAQPFVTLAPLAVRLMLAHVALGIAEGALAEARELSRRAVHGAWARGTADPPAPAPAADADLLLAFGESALAVHGAGAVVERATAAMACALHPGRDLDATRRADTAAHVATAEVAAARAALVTGERVLETAGADSGGLDRFWRNARVVTGHGPAGPALRAIGEHFLNDVRTPSWPRS